MFEKPLRNGSQTSCARCGPLVILAALASCAVIVRAAVYEVGEGQPYASIGSVPWESLSAGDLVLIHWQPTPYREKWVIGRTGTAQSPITIRGVLGPAGQRPVVDGQNATTRLALDYWNEERSVIKIGGSSIPPDVLPRYIVVENLDVRGARPPNSFTDDGGVVRTYSMNAAAIHVGRGEHVTIRNCILRDCGNGLFVTSTDGEAARDIVIEGNYFHGNGNSGSLFEHNTYTAAIDIVYQFNRFGPLLAGANGNNLKDRSAGLVVRYNWIEGGNRQLDLVDGEDSILIRNDPGYDETHVYGNVLMEPAGAGNKQITHYGGDSGATVNYRNGTLFFFQNTVVSTRTDGTTLFRLSTNDNGCDARNNLFYVTTAGTGLAMLDADGVLDLSHNWMKPGWRDTFGTLTGTINDDGTSVETSAPGFANEAAQVFEPAPASACVDEGGSLAPPVLPDHSVDSEYVKHQAGRARVGTGTLTGNGTSTDIGAFECRNPLDFDCDGDVDLDDYGVWEACLGAPQSPPAPAAPLQSVQCTAIFDDDTDGDVDLMDFLALQVAFTG